MLILRVGSSYKYERKISAVNGEEGVLESVLLTYRFLLQQKVALRRMHIFKTSLNIDFVFYSSLSSKKHELCTVVQSIPHRKHITSPLQRPTG
jgi:hypothetical protein